MRVQLLHLDVAIAIILHLRFMSLTTSSAPGNGFALRISSFKNSSRVCECNGEMSMCNFMQTLLQLIIRQGIVVV